VTPPVALPPSICVRLTRRCNAACGFCQAPDTDRRTVSLEEFERLCAWLNTRHVRSVKLSGGEPTVRRDLAQFVHVAARYGLRPTVVSNGILARPDVWAALSRAGGELKVSIHHADRANDLVLGSASFDRILANIRAARRDGVRCAINTVVNRSNRTELPDLARLAQGLSCHKITFIPFVPRGRGGELPRRALFELTPAETTEVYEVIERLSHELVGSVDVRCIDLRSTPYWIVENDLRLVEESWTETYDRLILAPDQLKSAIGSSDGAPVRLPPLSQELSVHGP
jgi:molybdenum cofactor biosynthesis enzyme MoaA